MRKKLRLLVIALIGICAARAAWADDFSLKNYVVFPLKTKLQQILAGSEGPADANVYAMIDMADVLDTDEKVDLQKLGDEFKTDLKTAAEQSGVEKPILAFWPRYSDLEMARKNRKAIDDALTKFYREHGFSVVRMLGHFSSSSWREHMQGLVDLKDDPSDTDETPIDDGAFRIYPVRTACSRFMLNGPNVDCFLEVRQPIDGRFSAFTAAQKDRITKSVAEFKLANKRTLFVKYRITPMGSPRAEQYFTGTNGDPAKIKDFVTDLGFATSTWWPAGQTVSAEGLLDKPAPDFTLKLLDGSEYNLHTKIRNKVAVVAFWGVGCPTSCEEAPALTALQKRFGEKDLDVIAVNSYDESEDVVHKFAREKELTHMIALQGSKVAKKYNVASYPVVYIVDSDGIVVDYHFDFEPGDEQRLVDAVTKFLSHENKKSGSN